MKTPISCKAPLLTVTAAVALTVATGALAQDRSRDGASHEITITKLTRGQQFTPILAATHMPSVTLFRLGQPASSELAILAKEGNVAPLTAALRTEVLEVVNDCGLTELGATTTLTVNGPGGTGSSRISVAAMPIPTNDTFFAVNGVSLPLWGETLALTTPAYDAGSERSDELCVSIPGPTLLSATEAVAVQRQRAAKKGLCTSVRGCAVSAASAPQLGTGATRWPE